MCESNMATLCKSNGKETIQTLSSIIMENCSVITGFTSFTVYIQVYTSIGVRLMHQSISASREVGRACRALGWYLTITPQFSTILVNGPGTWIKPLHINSYDIHCMHYDSTYDTHLERYVSKYFDVHYTHLHKLR
jgi:hypothetical protein